MSLLHRLEELAKIGATPEGGVTRRAFTPEDVSGRELVVKWMEESGLEVRFDGDMNITGYRRGSEGGKAIVTGSHLDTVPNGGRFDGALGVLAGIEAVASIKNPRHQLEVIVFTDEESTMCGSKGVTANRSDDIAALLELHVEQGPVLENTGNNLGVVTGIVGQRRFIVNFSGQANHAGTTPMDMRDDALVKASEFVMFVRRQALHFGNGLVATVGKMEVHPNAANVVADRVTLTVEFRDLDPANLDRFERVLSDRVNSMDGRMDKQYESTPVPCDPCIMWAVDKACRKFSDRVIEMPSRASHDAQELGRRWPMGMIFVPSAQGISHNPAEYTSNADCIRGTEVLAETIQILDNELN